QRAIRPLRADRLDDRRDAIEAAHAAVLAGKLYEILGAEGVGLGRAGGKPELLQEVVAGKVGNAPPCLAHSEVLRRLPEPDRDELRVQIRHVDERDVAELPEAQQCVLAQLALGEGTGQGAHGATNRRRCDQRRLHELAPRDHAATSLYVFEEELGQATVTFCSCLKMVPSSSSHVNSNVPVSGTLTEKARYGFAEIAGCQSL